MKKTFLVTIGDEITTENELDEINGGKLFSLIYRGTSFRECEISVKEISEEQNCGTPENTSENSKKPLRLSGNIAWENRVEDGDDYLDDRMNDLIDR